jgi:hypothetical protein
VIGPRAASILEQIRGLGEHHSAVEARLRESHETCTEELAEAAAAFEMALREVGRETDDPGTPPGNPAEPNPGDDAQDAPPPLDDAAASCELERMLARIRTADAELLAMQQRIEQLMAAARDFIERRRLVKQSDPASVAEANRALRAQLRRGFLESLLEPLLPCVSILVLLTLTLLLLRPILTTERPGPRATSATERTDAR